MVQVASSKLGGSDLARPEETPKLGWFVYILCFAAVIGGFLFGYDTGIVSAAMLYAPESKSLRPMNSVWQEVIVAVTAGTAAIGSVFAGKGSDHFGRKKVILGASLTFTVGSTVCAVAFDKVVLLIGRTLLGLAIGFSSSVVSVYVSESSPSHIRGILVTCFQMMITIGMVVANVIGGLFSYVDPENVGWRLMFGFAAIPATIQFVIFIFLPESPRWLHEHGQTKEAKEVLNKIYSGNVTWIDYELSEIEFSYKEELASKRENGDNPIFLRVLRTPHVLKALLIGCALQMFQQLSGINTVMYYTANIIRSAGVKDNHTTIWISVGTSAINFFGTFVPIFLIERLGRRILVLSSIVGVILSLSAMGVSFLLIHQDSAVSYNASLYTPATGFNDSYAHAVHCRSFTNCDTCVTDYACGFCEIKSARQGFCLPFSASDSADFSSTGLCSVVVNSTIEWENNYCHTKYTALPIIIMVIYLFCFSSGFAPVPWLLNAEFYPLWARSTCASISTSVNWIFNLIISLTFLSLTQALTKYGTFFLYAGCTVIAGVFIYFLVPETKGYSIDEIEMLFMTKKQRDQLKENVAREAARQRAESEQE